jgi:predicted outer membrane repeat protein
MSRSSQVVAGVLLALVFIAEAQAQRVYVDYSASGANDGSSWSDSFVSLQDALAEAAASGGAITELWIAQGTYRPDDGAAQTPGDTAATFQLLNGVVLYGGFASWETSRDQRNWIMNATILTGDIGVAGDVTDNSSHVVTGDGTDQSAGLDGVTVTLGHSFSGGGISITDGSPRVVNCRFVDNDVFDFLAGILGDGGAVYVTGTSAPSFQNCVFESNTADNRGGGAYVSGGTATFANCAFFDNITTEIGEGGALYVLVNATVTATNCLFVANSAAHDGGAVYSDSAAVSLVNCTLVGNYATATGGVVSVGQVTNSILWANSDDGSDSEAAQLGGTPTVSYSCVEGWSGLLGGVGNHGDSPAFVDPNGPDGDPGSWGDNDYRLLLTSPCIDAADSTAVPVDATDLDGDGNTTEQMPYDLDGLPRFMDVSSVADSGIGGLPVVDMGAYEVLGPGGWDCNANGIADHLDIAAGTSEDFNGDGIPDECELSSSIVASDSTLDELEPSPSSVQPGPPGGYGDLESADGDHKIFVFAEQSQRLATDLPVDHVVAGADVIDETGDLQPGTLPTDAIVHSYLMHFDPYRTPVETQTIMGSLTFDAEILGVIVLSGSLDASDNTLGAATTIYPLPGTVTGRGLDLDTQGQDAVVVSADRRTLTLTTSVYAHHVDQMRVITGIVEGGDCNGNGVPDDYEFPLAPATHYDTGNGPHSVSIADLNGDHVPDVAVANTYDDDVSVLLGVGDGTFGTAASYGAGSGPRSVAVGLLDNDHMPDLAVANGDGDNVSILLNMGNGTFAAAVSYATDSQPLSVAIEDLNGDQTADLAVANAHSDNVSVLLGAGDGTFAAASSYSAGDEPYSVAIKDLNDDQVPDLAVANRFSNDISVLLGVGDGTFAAAVNYAAGGGPTSIAIEDLNGDHVPDLAAASFDSDDVAVLLGSGSGTFFAAVSYAVGDGPASVAIGDFDADLSPDLAVANSGDNDVSVLWGFGDGTFAPAVNGPADNYAYSLAVADLNGDVILDLAVANFVGDTVSVMLNHTGHSPADIDEDCDVDLDDFGLFAGCMAGPGVITPPPACDPVQFARSDLDSKDGDVDMADFAMFQRVFGGMAAAPPAGMVLVPAGEFEMGDSFAEGDSDELPVHDVYLDAYYIDKYEVTNQKYADALNWAWDQGGLVHVSGGVVYQYGGTTYAYCDTTTSSVYSRIEWDGSTFSVTAGKEDDPMVEVSWYGAAAVCNWRSAMEGLTPCYDLAAWTCNFDADGYRLPTEAEWEKAAGWDPVLAYHFRFGEHTDGCGYNCLDGQRANNSGSGDPYETGPDPWTTPVGFYNGALHVKVAFGWPGSETEYQTQDAQSYYGCRDMSGNVWEWCGDWYDSEYYSSSPYNNPTGPALGAYRALRGGDWWNPARYCRSARRTYHTPDDGEHNVGFRCVVGSP